MEEYRTGYLLSYVVALSLSSFHHGYLLAHLNPSLGYIDRCFDGPLVYRTFAQALLVSILALGGIFGSVISKYLVQFGRRRMLIMATTVYIFAILLTFIPEYYVLLTGRFVQGICDGGFTFLIPLFSTMVREISPPEISGFFGSFYAFFIRIGFCIGYAIGLGIPHNCTDMPFYWRFIFGLPLITGAIQLVLLFFVFTFDSPKSLVSLGAIQESKNALRKIYSNEERVEIELEHIKFLLEKEKQQNLPYRELFSPNYGIALTVGSLMQVLNVCGGYFALIYFSTTIFAHIGGGNERGAIETTAFLGIFDICAVAFYAKFSDRYGRRTLLLAGVIGLIVINFAISLSARYRPEILPLFAFFFVLFHSSSVGPTAYIFDFSRLIVGFIARKYCHLQE